MADVGRCAWHQSAFGHEDLLLPDHKGSEAECTYVHAPGKGAAHTPDLVWGGVASMYMCIVLQQRVMLAWECIGFTHSFSTTSGTRA